MPKPRRCQHFGNAKTSKIQTSRKVQNAEQLDILKITILENVIISKMPKSQTSQELVNVKFCKISKPGNLQTWKTTSLNKC